MRTTSKQTSIFLIYAHVDKETVHKFYQHLTKDRIRTWWDAEDLQPGQDWQHEIRRAILKSDVVIVCLSRGFNKQYGYRHEELKIALEKANMLDDEVFIIPVRLEKCDMPESLRHLQRVDLFKPGGYKTLIRALRKFIESK